MEKQRYEKPLLELIDLDDDVICTSNGCPPVGVCSDECMPVIGCIRNCLVDYVPCDSGICGGKDGISNHTGG